MPTGDIGAIIDTLEFDAARCNDPHILQINGDVYAIVYAGYLDKGTVKTFTIDDAGAIDATAIDTFIFLNSAIVQPKIVHVAGEVYAIVYGGVDSDGFVSTVTISAAGVIGDAVIDTIEYDLYSGLYADIINVSGSVFAMACPGDTNRGWLHTITINADGTIDDAVIDSLQLTALTALYPNIISVTGDVYAIAYQGALLDGFVSTVTISAAGAIGDAVIDTLEFDTFNCLWPNIISVTGDVYAIAYGGVDSDGFVSTITIGADGAIGDAVIDTLEFDVDACLWPNIISVTGNVYAIAYSGGTGDGFLVTVAINADGTIDDAVIDTFEFDVVQTFMPNILYVAGNVYAIVYSGDWNHGHLITLGVETLAEGKTHHIMIMGMGQ